MVRFVMALARPAQVEITASAPIQCKQTAKASAFPETALTMLA